MTPEMLRRQLRLWRVLEPQRSACAHCPRAGVTGLPALPCAHRKAHLPGWGHGPHGTLSLLHLHPSELLPTPAGASRGYRCHAQGLRLWQHPADLWALPHGPLSATYWARGEPSENRALPVGPRAPTLTAPKFSGQPQERHYFYCRGTTGQRE